MVSKHKIDKILNNVKNTLEIEGLKVTDDEIKIGEKFLKGEISEYEALKLITEM